MYCFRQDISIQQEYTNLDFATITVYTASASSLITYIQLYESQKKLETFEHI